MNIDVALLPDQARTWRDSICIVVDVLRASSTVVVAFQRGARSVIPVASLSAGRSLARRDGHLFCSESDRSGAVGSQLDNSPSVLQHLDLRGKVIVLYTANGAGVIRKNAGARHLLVGSLLNARACAMRTVELHLETGANVGIICAGNHGKFALDDMFAAGYIARELQRSATAAGVRSSVTEQAAAATYLADCGSDPASFLADTWSGRWLAEYGPVADVAVCAQTNVSAMVPVAHTGRRLSLGVHLAGAG